MSSQIRDAIFWIAVASCAVAQLFIMRAVFKKPLVPATNADSKSETANASAGSDVAGASISSRTVPQPRRASEFAWALLPALFIALLFVGTWRSMHRTVVTSTPITIAPSNGVATQP